MINVQQTIKKLFHGEFSKMVVVISKQYGLSNIQLAEDVVSETFLEAAETWGLNGVPENPAAWLYVVAKRKTLLHFRRQKIFDNKIVSELAFNKQQYIEVEEPDFSHPTIKDSQLQMLFAICHPAIASEAQIGLALRILCGFGIDEIAEAFFTNKETVNKRLYRARKKLQTENIKMEMPPKSEIDGRLANVLHIIYLLFNEGYYSKTQNQTLRKDLCLEALRMGLILTEYKQTDTPETNALMALMCFHASRLDARQSADNSIILYDKQDTSLWDIGLIRQGMSFLEKSSRGGKLSSYHLEARIAWWHCINEDTPEKCEEILRIYDQLLKINYTPIVALNRIFALYKARGAQAALIEMEQLNPGDSHFYYVLLGELYSDLQIKEARDCFQKAYYLASSQLDKQIIQSKIDSLS